MPNPWCFRAENGLQVGAWKAKYFFLIRCRASGLFHHSPSLPSGHPKTQSIVKCRTTSRRTQSGPYFAHRFSFFVFISESGGKRPPGAAISKKKKQHVHTEVAKGAEREAVAPDERPSAMITGGIRASLLALSIFGIEHLALSI
jgi:hypothetical protein